VTLVTSHDRLLRYQEDKIFAKALILVLICSIGMVILTVSFMPGGLISSLLSYYGERTGESSAVLLSATPSDVPIADIGEMSGFVMGSGGSPVEGASIVIYKIAPLIDSFEKKVGYTTYTTTNDDGSYSFSDFPSGVYRVTVMYPDDSVHVIENYAVWPSSSSSYDFVKH
jgi:Carboxypeptidase regulatory-like domain